MTGGGDDTTSPYQGSYTWDEHHHRLRQPNRHREQRRQHDRHLDLHRHQRHHRPDRPDRRPRRRPLVHHASPSRSPSTTAPTPAPGIDAASGVVERATATLTNGTCGSFGSWNTVTLTGGADTTVTSGNCYRYRYTITDNVGNTVSTVDRLRGREGRHHRPQHAHPHPERVVAALLGLRNDPVLQPAGLEHRHLHRHRDKLRRAVRNRQRQLPDRVRRRLGDRLVKPILE